MNCTVLLSANNSNKTTETISSLLQNSIKPKYICILQNKDTDEQQLEITKVFTRSCCDKGTYSEEFTSEYTIAKKENSEYTIVSIMGKDKNITELKNIAIEYIDSDSNIFITATSGSTYEENYIQKYVEALSIENTGACYSDYIESDKYVYLSSLYPNINHNVPIKEIGFINLNNSVKYENENINLIQRLYAVSIVRHIPEALFKI
jgi:hypothetical protein